MAYDRITPSGSDTGSPLNLSKRLAFIERHLRVQGRRVIDCGCGTGQYVHALFLAGADIQGIEYNAEQVDACLRAYPELIGRVARQDVEEMQFPARSFDGAILNEVLEHVTHQDRALEQVFRVLKDDGLLFVFSPNRFYPFETHSVVWERSNTKLPIYAPFVPYIPLGLGRRVFRYVARNYWPGELRRLVRSHGFSIVATGFLWQTFENNSGSQPGAVTALRRLLRPAFSFLEKVPLVNSLGVSQVIVARKPHASSG